MELLQWHKRFLDSLANDYTPNEITDLFKRLLIGFFDWEPTILGLEPNRQLSIEQELQLSKALEDITSHRPLQYILGHTYFMGLQIKVTPATLIPRPETEELVSWVLETHKYEAMNVLDIGTGSGCIALGVKHQRPNWTVHALDVSEDALKVARKNSKQLALDIQFIQTSIDNAQAENEYHIIISNPPYVTLEEKKEMKPNVLDYEPHLALFVPPEDPLIYYEQIFQFAQTSLHRRGEIFLEINPHFCQALQDLALSYGFQKHRLRTDIFEKKRLLSLAYE